MPVRFTFGPLSSNVGANQFPVSVEIRARSKCRRALRRSQTFVSNPEPNNPDAFWVPAVGFGDIAHMSRLKRRSRRHSGVPEAKRSLSGCLRQGEKGALGVIKLLVRHGMVGETVLQNHAYRRPFQACGFASDN